MRPIQLVVNARLVSDSVEPRTHLADFLRDRLNLTGTHLRCEQGACGACTLLIDGQPARSCIIYAVLCDGATITTIEGLEDDPVIAALRQAFSQEHGLQCGYCTPGMLVTARDIVMRLPGADQARIRSELSGNLCRCTGYVGIVRAISRVLDQRRNGEIAAVIHQEGPLGPVGARPAARPSAEQSVMTSAAPTPRGQAGAPTGAAILGLAGRKPNVEIRQSVTVSRSPEEVWKFFADIPRVVRCLPGASLTQEPAGGRVEGKMSVKLGPVTANFAGEARVERDDERLRGVIRGAGRDQFGGSRTAGEVEYVLLPAGSSGGTRVELTIRTLLVGPLAQFGRSGIVEDLVARITETFARNLEARLTGAALHDDEPVVPPLQAGALFRRVIVARLKALFARIFRTPGAG
jgi:aerobic carbon-monoxide dehydrogenase small subunit